MCGCSSTSCRAVRRGRPASGPAPRSPRRVTRRGLSLLSQITTPYYTLAGTELRATDLAAWQAWRTANPDYHIVPDGHVGGMRVSTVFHGGYISGDLVLFEVSVFMPDGREVFHQRYSTWDEAAGTHFKIVNLLVRISPSEGWASPPPAIVSAAVQDATCGGGCPV